VRRKGIKGLRRDQGREGRMGRGTRRVRKRGYGKVVVGMGRGGKDGGEREGRE
jgi:hypothetical protein